MFRDDKKREIFFHKYINEKIYHYFKIYILISYDKSGTNNFHNN